MRRVTRRGVLAGVAAGAAALGVRPAWALAPSAEAARPIESFGKVGGADDTATFEAAARSGEPFRLAGRSYRVAGPVRIHAGVFAMYGVPGVTRILCAGAGKGAWFQLDSTGVVDVEGVIWDGDGRAGADAPGMVVLSGAPRWLSLRRVGVMRSTGAAGLLLSLDAEGKAEPAALDLREIEAGHNAGAGIWVEHAASLLASGLRLHDNKAAGIRFNRFANRAGTPVRRVVLRDSFAWGNGGAGFAVGVYNEAPGGQAKVAGPNLADAEDVDLAGLFAWGNGGYGVAVQGQHVRLAGSRTWRNGPHGGVVANARRCRIVGCTVRDEREFGIDAGGSDEVDVSDCRVLDIAGTGLNLGGGRLITGSGNQVLGCTGKAVHVADVEFGGGAWLQYRARRLVLRDTTVDLARMAAGPAVFVEAGAREVLLDGLELVDTAGRTHDPATLVVALTDSIRIRRARLEGAARFPVAPEGGVLTVPDIAEAVVLPGQNVTLTAVRTHSMALVGDGIAWIRVTAPGRGYTARDTTAMLSGDGDVAAVGRLVPQVWAGRGGELVGIGVPHPGRGFRRATVTIQGRGQGARAEVQVGLPLPRERRLTLIFPGGGRLGGSLPNVTVGRDGVVSLLELDGRWIVADHG